MSRLAGTGRAPFAALVFALSLTLLGGLSTLAQVSSSQSSSRPGDYRGGEATILSGAALLILALGYTAVRQRMLLRQARAVLEQDRRARAGHHDHLAKYVNDSVFLADDRMRIVEANDRASETYGYTRDEFLTLTVADLRDVSDSQRLTAHWERAGELGSLRFETVHRRKDGTAFPVEVSTRVLDVAGKPYRQSIIRDVTGRKEMERNLHVALDELSALIAASPAAIVSVTPEGNVKAWNAAAERLFGWKAEEVIGQPLPFVPPESAAESRDLLDRALAGETITGLELRRLTKDGRLPWLRLSVAPVRDPSGDPNGIMAVLLDISGEKRAGAILRESERRFRAAFEQAAVGMAHIGFDGRLIRANRRLADIAGYRMEHLSRLRLPDLIHPEDRSADEAAAARLRAGETETYSVEKRLVRSDGRPVWVNLTVSLLRSEMGEPVHLSAVIEDIDERHRAREASRESERKFRSVVENAPEGIFVQSGNIIRYANRMALASFGASSESELTGMDPFSRFHPDFHDLIRERIRRLESGHPVSTVEEVWVRLDGSTFEVEASAIPHEHDGQAGVLVFFRDITRRKQAARERRRLEEEFHQLQKMESIGRLAGGIAHDCNNHLTVINGYCSMLLDRLPAQDPSREVISQVLQAGGRSADLVRQLLSFSRKQIVEPRATDVNDALTGLHPLLERLIGEDIRLVIERGKDAGCVFIDPGQLNQVLMNLAVNARDAMPRGGTLLIETAAINDALEEAEPPAGLRAGSYLALSVSDSGVGMTPDVRARIFEPFFTTKGDAGGTGLGLSTVYGIVRQAGGWIAVNTELGRGSAFKIYLPRTAPAPAPPEIPAQSAAELAGVESILVVEDQCELRRLAVDVLKQFGYRVLEAADGPSALKLCARLQGPLHLLLTDVIMPGMTGRELADHLVESLPGLRVLYMSGYAANVIADRGVLEPGLEYLAKPFTPDQLARKVRAVLDAQKPPPTILIVDDQDGVRALLRKILNHAGFHVVEASDGKPASRIVRENPDVRLVITDLVMPEQEGLETIRIIKKDRPDLKVVAISGAFEGQFLRTASLFGADATMPKPIDGSRLIECVRGLLS